MKVLLVNTLYHPNEFGGAERMVKRLADALLALGLAPEIACLAPDGVAATGNVGGVPVHRVPLHNVYPMFPVEHRPAALKPLWHAIDSANIPMARALGRIADRVRPDVVHTHNITGFSPLAWRSLSRRRIPIVHTLHDHYLLCPRSTMYVDGQNCTSRHLVCAGYSVARLAHSSKVDAVVGVSRYILERHASYGAFPNAVIRRVIPNPVLGGGSGAPDVPSAGAATLRIGYLGRLDPPKGLDDLLAACEGLPAAGWRLDVGGSGVPQYERELRARATTSPNIRFLSQVDTAGFLRSVDVLVVPSRLNDSLPLVVLEAHAFGVPVIASRIGGIPEVVEEGRTGFLVPPGAPADLRAILARVIAEPAIVRSMRSACIAAAVRFAPNVIAREYADVYSAVTL